MHIVTRAILDSFLQLLLDNPVHHLLQDTHIAASRAGKVPLHALLNILAHDINLNVDIVARPLGRRHDLLLRVGNKHDLEEPISTVHNLGHGQAGTVEGDIALLDDIPHDAYVARLQPEDEGIAFGRHGEDFSDGVDMALDEVAAHACFAQHGALEVHARVRLQRAEIRAAEGFGCDADLEPGLIEGRDGQTGSWRWGGQMLETAWACRRGTGGRRRLHTIDGDAVAQMSVGEDLLAVGDGQRGAPAPA